MYWWLPRTRSSEQSLRVTGSNWSMGYSRLVLSGALWYLSPKPMSSFSVTNSQKIAEACVLVGTWTVTDSPGFTSSLLSGRVDDSEPEWDLTWLMKCRAALGVHQRAAGARTLLTGSVFCEGGVGCDGVSCENVSCEGVWFWSCVSIKDQGFKSTI